MLTEKKNNKLCLIELVVIAVYALLKIISTNYFASIALYFDGVFFLGLLCILLYKFGLPRNKNYLNRISIRYMIILLLSYLLVAYCVGCFTGFTRPFYNQSLSFILINSFPVIIFLVSREMIRYIVSKNSTADKRVIIILTIFFIIVEIYNSASGYHLNSFYNIFNFTCVVVLPTIASQILCSYITYNISNIPTLIYCLAFSIAPFILPLYPDLGNYLNSALNLIFPFIVYMVMRNLIKSSEKKQNNLQNTAAKLIGIPVVIFLGIIVILVSGIFEYQMIAIGSDSMNPTFYKGDAIIFKKVSADEVAEGDVLVFSSNGKIITHRVEQIIKKGDQIFFQTKGDNNTNSDAELVSEEDTLGIVRYIVKYIGYPTIWINENF